MPSHKYHIDFWACLSLQGTAQCIVQPQASEPQGHWPRWDWQVLQLSAGEEVHEYHLSQQKILCFLVTPPPPFPTGSSSYSKRGGQADNRTVTEDPGRKGSSGSSTTKVPASPLVPSDRKKSATPSTVRHCHTRKMKLLVVSSQGRHSCCL